MFVCGDEEMKYNLGAVETKVLVPTIDQLMKFSLKELRRYAKNLKVPTGKTKNNVVVNLVESRKVYILASLERL